MKTNSQYSTWKDESVTNDKFWTGDSLIRSEYEQIRSKYFSTQEKDSN